MSDFILQINEIDYDISFFGEKSVKVNGKEYSFELLSQFFVDNCSIKIDDRTYSLTIVNKDKNEFVFFSDGVYYEISLSSKHEKLLKTIGLKHQTEKHNLEIKSPMPGMVLKILKNKGSQVDIGEPVMILEAMKMENIIKTPFSGVIEQIFVRENIAVEKGVKLFKIS